MAFSSLGTAENEIRIDKLIELGQLTPFGDGRAILELRGFKDERGSLLITNSRGSAVCTYFSQTTEDMEFKLYIVVQLQNIFQVN